MFDESYWSRVNWKSWKHEHRRNVKGSSLGRNLVKIMGFQNQHLVEDERPGRDRFCGGEGQAESYNMSSVRKRIMTLEAEIRRWNDEKRAVLTT